MANASSAALASAAARLKPSPSDHFMEKKKPIGFVSGRFFLFFTAVVSAVFYAGYLDRELWFDEVLTLQFALLPSPLEIYRSYTIPNNQIVHTWFIHWLVNCGIPPESMRLFPLLCAILTIIILWRAFSREKGSLPLTVALTALMVSPPFLLYASALRGYMLAALLTVSALCSARKYALSGNRIALALWFLSAFFACGVMPSALAGIGAAGLYSIPYCGKKYWRNRRVYLLAATAIAGFLLFYAPIVRNLLQAFDLKEGWHEPFAAILAVTVAVAVTFLLPLAAGAFFHHPRLRELPRTLIWFLPLGALILPVYPFPRVWFILFPVMALLTAGYLRRLPEKGLKILWAAALFWGIFSCTALFRESVSLPVSRGGQDDFYAPRFVRQSFTPSLTARMLCREYAASGSGIFITFDADPFALNYALAAADKEAVLPPVVIDVPFGKVKGVPENTLCVLSADDDPAVYEKRFTGKLWEVYHNGIHKVYLFRRESK